MSGSSPPRRPVLPSDRESSLKECSSPKQGFTNSLSSPTMSMLTPYTVVIGRGKKCHEFVGNKRLEVLAKTVLHRYAEADGRAEKGSVVSYLIRSVQDGGGTFVRMVDEDHFEQANDRITREKVGVVLRNLLHDKYRSSTKSKVATRRQQARLAKSSASSNGSSDSSASSTSGPRDGEADEPFPDQVMLSNENNFEILVGDGSECDDTSDAPSSRSQRGSVLEHHSLEPQRPSLDQELLSCENIFDLPGDGDEKDDGTVEMSLEQNMDDDCLTNSFTEDE
jgi:hypothetical protein